MTEEFRGARVVRMHSRFVLLPLLLGGCHLLVGHTPAASDRALDRPASVDADRRLDTARDRGDSRASERRRDDLGLPDLQPIAPWFVAAADTPPASPADVTGLAVDPASGEIVVVGWFFGELRIQMKEVTAASLDQEDLFIARFSPQGTLLHLRGHGGAGKEVPRAVAIDGWGRTLIVGSFTGSSPVGGLSNGSSDGFVAAFDAKGDPLWSKRLGGPGSDELNGAALAGNTLHLVGTVADKHELGGVTYPVNGALALLVAKLPLDGGPSAPAFAAPKLIDGDPGTSVRGRAIAVNSVSICVAGDYLGTLQGKLSASQDVLAACLDHAGKQLWLGGWGSPTTDVGLAIAIDQDDVYLAGRAGPATNFGCGALGSGSERPFLARLTPGGLCRWSSSWGLTAAAGLALVALGKGVVLGGEVAGPLSLLTGQLPELGPLDGLVGRLDEDASPTPVHVWGERLGGLGASAAVRALAVDPGRRSVYAGGSFSGTLTKPTVLASVGQDGFLYRRSLDP